MAPWRSVVKNVLQLCGMFLLVVAMCLTFAAMFSSEWQIAEFGQGDVHYHGLWRYCESGPNKIPVKTTNGDWICYVKSDASKQNSRHPFLNWQMTTLALLSASCCVAFVSLILGCVTWCAKFCSVGFGLMSLLSTLCSASAIFIFFRWSQDTENQIERNERDEMAKQTLGLSFHLALAGCATYFVTSLLTISCAALVFLIAKKNQSADKSRPRITIA